MHQMCFAVRCYDLYLVDLTIQIRNDNKTRRGRTNCEWLLLIDSLMCTDSHARERRSAGCDRGGSNHAAGIDAQGETGRC